MQNLKVATAWLSPRLSFIAHFVSGALGPDARSRYHSPSQSRNSTNNYSVMVHPLQHLQVDSHHNRLLPGAVMSLLATTALDNHCSVERSTGSSRRTSPRRPALGARRDYRSAGQALGRMSGSGSTTDRNLAPIAIPRELAARAPGCSSGRCNSLLRPR